MMQHEGIGLSRVRQGRLDACLSESGQRMEYLAYA